MPQPNTAFICTLLNSIPGLPSNMFKLFFSFLTVFSLFYAQSCHVATTRGALQAVYVRGRQGTATCDVNALGRPCPSRERLSPSRCQGNALTPPVVREDHCGINGHDKGTREVYNIILTMTFNKCGPRAF